MFESIQEHRRVTDKGYVSVVKDTTSGITSEAVSLCQSKTMGRSAVQGTAKDPRSI